MDRRSNFPYSRRSRPPPNYAEDDDEDDVVLGSEIRDSDDDDSSDDDEYNGPHHPRKQRRINGGDFVYDPRATSSTVDSSSNGGFWSEQMTFVLLESWGDRFLQLGRCSLRNEDWNDVAERVSEATRSKLSVSDCRNRLYALKIRYRKEKSKVGSSVGGVSKWVFFKKMDALMTMSPRQLQQQEQCGLACGVDSGEFVFMNPRVYLNHANALDEMRDSPGNSESEGEDDEDDPDEDEDDEDVVDDDDDDEGEEESYRMLSESIKRVGEIYEKIEDSKRQHMMELERMRSEFQRELELQKKEMIDRTKAEVAKLRQGDDEGSGCSAENVEWSPSSIMCFWHEDLSCGLLQQQN